MLLGIAINPDLTPQFMRKSFVSEEKINGVNYSVKKTLKVNGGKFAGVTITMHYTSARDTRECYQGQYKVVAGKFPVMKVTCTETSLTNPLMDPSVTAYLNTHCHDGMLKVVDAIASYNFFRERWA